MGEFFLNKEPFSQNKMENFQMMRIEVGCIIENREASLSYEHLYQDRNFYGEFAGFGFPMKNYSTLNSFKRY